MDGVYLHHSMLPFDLQIQGNTPRRFVNLGQTFFSGEGYPPFIIHMPLCIYDLRARLFISTRRDRFFKPLDKKNLVVLPGVHQLPATSLFFIAAAVEQQTIATAEIGRIILIYSPRIELTASLVSMDSKHLFFSQVCADGDKEANKTF